MKRPSKDPKYTEWRKKVIKRDKHKCQMPNCKKMGRDVHHILRWADSPSLRYEPNNGILLCKTCHKSITGKESFFRALFFEIVKRNNDNNTR